MNKTAYRTAVHDSIRDAMLADPRVVLMGEDVGAYGGTYAASKGLLAEFGPDRIRDTPPLSELGFVGIGIGAALGGLRPIVEVMTVNFSLLALDQIVNTAAALRHMSGGQFSVPLVVRMATGGRAVSWPPSTRTAWRLVRPHPGHQGGGPRPRWRMPTGCCPPRWPTRIRWSSSSTCSCTTPRWMWNP